MKLNAAHFIEFDIEPLEGKDVNAVMFKGCQVLGMLNMKYWLSAGKIGRASCRERV